MDATAAHMYPFFATAAPVAGGRRLWSLLFSRLVLVMYEPGQCLAPSMEKMNLDGKGVTPTIPVPHQLHLMPERLRSSPAAHAKATKRASEQPRRYDA